MDLGPRRRAAHLRRMSHGAGARVGESSAGSAAANNHAGRSDRRESCAWFKGRGPMI